MVRTAQNKIFIFREGEKVQIEAYGEHIIRVRASKGEIEDLNWTLLPPKEDQASVSEEGDNVVLENGGIRAVVSSDGKIAFKNQAGEVLFEELWRNERDIDARVLRGHVGGSSHIELHLRQYAGEHFYGLGQEAHDLFDLKGAMLDLCQQNTKSTIPFVMSSRGYGFIWNNPAIGRVEFGTSGTRWVAESARQMDYLVIAGDTPGEIEHRYCEVTGYAPEFPEWATGLWQSKLRYETQDELMEVAREYKRRGITPSIIVCDYFHWPQQGEWKFDKKYWPEPEKMVKELNEMGIRLLVSIWPTVDPRSENFIEMRDQNMLIRSERGPGTLMYCRGPETYYDPTNPEARKFVWNKAKENYYNLGIRNFWLDEAEPEITPWRKLIDIKIPLVMPSIYFVMLTAVIDAFQIFTEIFIMTKGGPGYSTYTVSYYLWSNAFEYSKMGYACAMAAVMFVIILAITLIQNKVMSKKVDYEA